jgi:protein-disulfide isomerase
VFLSRRQSLILGAKLTAALLLASCEGAGGGGAVATSPDDMAIGNPSSGVTLIEYGSTMCSHCADFHETVFRQIKENYIDNGRIHFVFREMLTPVDPQQIVPTVALAQYQLARCADASSEQYFNRLSVLFEQQPAMFQAGSRQGIEEKLVEVGGAAGLSRDQVLACVADPSGAQRLDRLSDLATRDNVTGTPAFFLNGRRLDDASAMTYEGMSAALDAEIRAVTEN